jgi:3-mercaptopyruvate sulfurtransferase SseA
MIAELTSSIVSVAWLHEHLAAENLVIFDARMKPVFPTANAPSEAPVYIPDAVRFDFDDVLCDHSTPPAAHDAEPGALHRGAAEAGRQSR